jgi:hypothetical protein
MAKTEEVVGVWASDPGTAADYFRDPNFHLSRLTTSTPVQDMTGFGWTKIGMGTLTLTKVSNENQVILNIIDDLRKRQTSARAEAEEKVTRIEEQINRLLAIENKQAFASNIVAAADADDDIPF